MEREQLAGDSRMYQPLTYEKCKGFLSGQRLPCAFVDLDAFDANIASLTADLDSSDKTMRVASKSIRSVGLLRRIFERGGRRLKGIMGFTVEEADYLSRNGFDNILIAYPTMHENDMKLMAEMTARGVDVQLVVDSAEGAARLGQYGRKAGVKLQAVIEIDMSYRKANDRIHWGVRRSPVATGADAIEVARAAEKTGGAVIAGIMGYEAQIAGMGDRNPFSKAMNPVRRMVRSVSKPYVVETRGAVVDFLRKNGIALRIVNGGGTGSVVFTSGDACVTEVTAGSGFCCPHLFSYYSELDLKPAAFFAVQVVRIPAAGMVTCLGGGYIASGEAGADRLPVPYLPQGLTMLAMEGAGEVQTPLVMPRGMLLKLGDPVVFRHAKSGELSERFSEFLLVSDARVTGVASTYRGDGKCFL